MGSDQQSENEAKLTRPMERVPSLVDTENLSRDINIDLVEPIPDRKPSEEIDFDRIYKPPSEPVELTVYENKCPIIGILIPFSILGTLIRVGLQSLETYNGAPVFGLVYAQWIGCFIMGVVVWSKIKLLQWYLPLHTGLSTGLCGSITTFSSWQLDIFKEFSNYHGADHATGYNILAAISQLLVTIAVSLCGLQFGYHAGKLWTVEKEKRTKIVACGYSLRRLKAYDYCIMIFGVLSWVAVVMAAIFTPSRRDVALSCVFAPVGALLRWYLARLNTIGHGKYPWGTFTANVFGTAVLGGITVAQSSGNLNIVDCDVTNALATGFCGCLTTISTFTVELTTLPFGRSYKYAVISIVLSQVLMFAILVDENSSSGNRTERLALNRKVLKTLSCSVMPPKGKKPAGSLGRAVIRSRFQGQRAIAIDEGKLHTTDIAEEPNWVKMQSITQENDLEAFLSTAQLAETDFTAERLNVRVVEDNYLNPFLLSENEEKERLKKQEANVDKLAVPRRPQWDKSMTAEQVQRNEREAFLEWRRGMAKLEEEEGLLLTPFERNIEVWRQLWRVIERSQLVVQIVDARNPLLFRSADLEKYVKEVDPQKRNLLLINKGDFLTTEQRRRWADHLDAQGIRYTFFSAALAAKQQEEEKARKEKEDLEKALRAEKAIDDDDDTESHSSDEENTDKVTEDLADTHISEQNEQPSNEDERIRIRTTTDLLDLLIEETPKVDDEQKITIGLVGYPNVGKSSTINALIGEKRVSVSSTPGKTKHFQTIHLTPSIVLCDCPGLVFPTFSTTKADQVCNGVLPIDQLREHTGPTGLVARRIPQNVLEQTYGIRIRVQPIEDGGTGIPTSAELCSTYAIARGYFRSSQGNPDEARAARYILKDYVNGKLLFCHPPPGYDADEFNRENHEAALKVHKKLAPTTRVPANALSYVAPAGRPSAPLGSKTEAVDNAFFKAHMAAPSVRGKAKSAIGAGYSRTQLYPHQRMIADDGTLIPQGRRERLALAASVRGDSDVSDKKHKKGKRSKARTSGAGYDYL
ncbi:hypothetical protein EC973_003501 [Apophysomyces ossiformis]|uniref:CP-type G domain-containing protein n=1 Tax=Apophysomyces ossiformis TaxID=679940 RepID=A0A8H7BR82_9FUNG|nr:hypothetical protein EC973_003501 [Apophysomyces ossiformis]